MNPFFYSIQYWSVYYEIVFKYSSSSQLLLKILKLTLCNQQYMIVIVISKFLQLLWDLLFNLYTIITRPPTQRYINLIISLHLNLPVNRFPYNLNRTPLFLKLIYNILRNLVHPLNQIPIFSSFQPRSLLIKPPLFLINLNNIFRTAKIYSKLFAKRLQRLIHYHASKKNLSSDIVMYFLILLIPQWRAHWRLFTRITISFISGGLFLARAVILRLAFGSIAFFLLRWVAYLIHMLI